MSRASTSDREELNCLVWSALTVYSMSVCFCSFSAGSQGMKPTNVDGAGLDVLFNLIVGQPGTFVQLFFRSWPF